MCETYTESSNSVKGPTKGAKSGTEDRQSAKAWAEFRKQWADLDSVVAVVEHAH